MNNFKKGKNLFGISSYGSSSGLFVDLTTNQSINGIKRFLTNLITNGNVNFNTSSNIGRIVFKPNEPAGFGGNLVAIYTVDENDGSGWIFDADGFLYYQGTGFISQKIIFDPTGAINAVGSITGSSLSAGTGTISTTGNISGGSLFVGSGAITGGAGSFSSVNCSSLNANSGTIQTTGAISGGAGSFTTGSFTSNVNITGASNGLTISGGFSGLFCNKIESQSGGAIVSSAVFNLRSALAVTNITLDPLNTIRLKINGITGTNSYLFFNNSNTLGFFNTSTGTNTYTITASGAITCSSLNASSTIQTTTNIVAGNGLNVNAGDINAFGNLEMLSTAFVKSGFGNHNTINPYSGTTINIGITSNFNWLKSVGVNRIKFFPSSTTGDIIQITRTGDNAFGDGYWYHNNLGNNGYISAGIGRWELTTNGDLSCRNISSTGYINTSGQYIYNQHSLTGDICGLWSNRSGVSGTIFQNGNAWACMGGLENNTGGNIGGGAFNSGNNVRQFLWLIETTTSSGKALGLACNRTSAPNSSINTATQNTNYALLGFYATNRGGAAYSFTGEHSSMVCDEEYDDLMNYNTDDFIGMVVCSSGRIYNLPYDVDGNTYTKQVDNIKSVDSQPMTRLSKKYKDKSVLGVISHIEKIGKDRNDLNATSWTGCMALDKDERRRIRVASIGEGGVWVTNEYGNIENGDYITTSNIPGYSTKQDDDLLHNYTISKATMDCSFDIEKPDDYKTKYLGDNIYASYISCTFHCG